jgi:cytochrome P450
MLSSATLFSDDARRNPFALYEEIRKASPVVQEPQGGIWMVFDYDGVRQALTDTDAFSSKNGPDWLIFNDPPRHTKLRALISQAFTARSIATLESRVRDLSRDLLDKKIESREIDIAADFAIPLPLIVIAELLGIPIEDRGRFRAWNDVLLRMSYTVVGTPPPGVIDEFVAATREMGVYLAGLLEIRRSKPRDDLLTRLLQAEVDGEHLTPEEILGFFQLLLLAGSETTTNLISNAFVCFMENPDQLARLGQMPDLLTSAIEEVLRFRSPLQWMYRITKRDVLMHGQTIPAGKLVLAFMGSANHDPKYFHEPNRFDIARNPNPHLAFGHGIHFCLGAPLSRLEGRVAVGELLRRMKSFTPATEGTWKPREGLHVHGPASLPIRFEVR